MGHTSLESRPMRTGRWGCWACEAIGGGQVEAVALWRLGLAAGRDPASLGCSGAGPGLAHQDGRATQTLNNSPVRNATHQRNHSNQFTNSTTNKLKPATLLPALD